MHGASGPMVSGSMTAVSAYISLPEASMAAVSVHSVPGGVGVVTGIPISRRLVVSDASGDVRGAQTIA